MIFLFATIAFLIVWRLPIKLSGRLNCDPTGGIATAAIMVAAGSAQAYSQVKQGQAQKKYYDSLANTARAQGDAQLAVAQKQAEISEDVGAQQVKAEAIKGAEAQGAQRVAEAANGIAGSGTAQDIAIDSMRKTQQNEINLKYNTDTKAWEFDTQGKYEKWSADQQANQYNAAGKQALGAAKRAAAITMLSTAVSVGTFGAMGGLAGAAAKGGVGVTTSAGAGSTGLMPAMAGLI